MMSYMPVWREPTFNIVRSFGSYMTLVATIYGRFAPLSVRPLDVSPLGRFATWTIRPQDVSPPGRFATTQWTIRPLEW